MTDEDNCEDDDQFPWEDVEAARKNQRLQQKHPAADGQPRYAAIVKACPQCQNAASQLSWFYFSSPDETWENLCGQAGWMTVCDRCHRQVDFFCEMIN